MFGNFFRFTSCHQQRARGEKKIGRQFRQTHFNLKYVHKSTTTTLVVVSRWTLMCARVKQSESQSTFHLSLRQQHAGATRFVRKTLPLGLVDARARHSGREQSAEFCRYVTTFSARKAQCLNSHKTTLLVKQQLACVLIMELFHCHRRLNLTTHCAQSERRLWSRRR